MEEHARQIKLKQEQEMERAVAARLLREKQQAMVSRFKSLKFTFYIFPEPRIVVVNSVALSTKVKLYPF